MRYFPLNDLAIELKNKTELVALLPGGIHAYEPIEVPSDTYLVLDVISNNIYNGFIRDMRIQATIVATSIETTAESLQQTMEILTECMVSVRHDCKKGLKTVNGVKIISIYESGTYRPSFTDKGVRCLIVDYFIKYCVYDD